MPRKKSATVALQVRMKEPLRANIAAAAKRRGISLNAEAVRRMTETGNREEAFSDVAQRLFGFGGGSILAMRAFGRAIADIEQESGHSWHEDWNTARRVRSAFSAMVTMFGPEPPSQPTDKGELINENIGMKAGIRAVKEELPNFVDERVLKELADKLQPPEPKGG